MKKKVILILPKTGVDPDKPHAPHSIMALATPLLDAGYKPILIDTRVTPNYRRIIKNNIKETLCVGITTMTGYQIKHGLNEAKFIRGLDPKIPIIWGGVHPTSLPEQTAKNPYVDIVVRGEGEVILPMICKKLEGNKNLEDVPSITYKTKQGIKSNPGTAFMDLDKIKREPWHLIDVKKYMRKEMGVDKVLTLLTSKGCPGRCTFCYNYQFNKSKWRGHKAKYVVDEIEFLIKEYGINGIYFIEDNFFVDKQRVRDICEGIIKRGIKVSLGASCRIDTLSRYEDEFMALLKKAGFNFLFCGVESGSQKILNSIKKGITIEQVLTTTKKLKDYDITTVFTFMAGFPNETKKDLYMTLDLIDKIKKINPKANISSIFNYTPLPGAEMYKLVVQHGFKEPKKFEDWGSYIFFTSTERLEWLPKKQRKFIRYLSFISRFAFYQEAVERSFENPFMKIIYKILKQLAAFRWKHRFFKFPIEWWFVYKTFKLMAG